ncbi:MAG: YihA family ribosome biogenesis GTP-binding protein [Actinobacteria bacterium]|nr:YihA family ribosome biogenesis GTP-binding protein [Actinomycetota bacterium]
MSGLLRLSFVSSVSDHRDLPELAVEVAVVGRSNVGKSSLVNALANHKNLAKVSKTPGRTQLINLFLLSESTGVVDLPGYGYAAVPSRVKAGWGRMIESYLIERESLVEVLVLVDGEVGPTKLDVQMIEYLQANGVPMRIVATKHDKVKSSKRETRKRDLAAGCGVAQKDVMWVSADSGLGIETLRNHILGVLKND